MGENDDNDQVYSKLTREQAQAIMTYLNDQYNRSLSHRWFFLGIIIGISGNLFASVILDFIKIRYVTNWITFYQIIGLVSTVLFSYYLIRAYYEYQNEKIKHRQLLNTFQIDKIIKKAYFDEKE